MAIEVERDESIRAFELTDYDGDESEVVYYEKGQIPLNPVYKVGMGKRKFIVVSCMDGNVRVNRLLISDKILKTLK